MDVVFGLGTASSEGAFARSQSGVYYDKTKHHTLNHKGKISSARGLLNIALALQVGFVIAQAGGSEPGKDMAARTAEIVF